MNIVLKNSLKNIFGKPFRTLLVVFAIFVCSLCALLCFDLSESITRVLTDFMGSISRADFMVVSGGSDLSKLPDGFPEADMMTINCNNEMLYKDIDGEYCYVTTDSLSIYGIDVDEAVDMKFIKHIDLKDDEMYITSKFAEDFGYKAGDKIIVHDRSREPVELTIGGILPEDNKNPLINGNDAIVNLNTSDKLSCGFREANVAMIDLKDDSKISDAKKMLEERFPDAQIADLFLTESDMDMINELKAVFYLLFAVTFLLVIFVTASICNRIVSERMSYIGTLRSLGMSTARTGRILLLENVLYALMGSIPATILYSLIRLPILNMMFMGEDSSGNAVEFELPGYPVALVIGVILGAVLIECLIPLRAILKALKTSIRDIIFDNRDTEYKFNRSTLIFGLICLAVAIPTFFLRKNIFFATICLVAAVAALAFLFPRILKLVTTGVKKVADKFEKSTWSLASVEAISRKSTVGSGVLCATAAAMCIVVYALTGGLTDSINVVPYNCDVVMETTKENKYYTYIEHLDGVTDSETLYTALKLITVNDETKEGYGYYFGMPDGGYKYYEGFKGLPDKIEEGCVCLDKSFASRKGIKAGDTIKITINPESVFPVVREYKVTNIVECNNNGYSGESIIVNEAEYKFLFRDTPGEILIKCEDPDAIKKTLETYAKGNYNTVETFDEKVENLNSSNSKTIAVVTAIIIVALGMTAIGMISNQLIGFEGRKKECAVMLSTVMNKSRLSGILLKEVLITSTTASAAGTIVGTILTFELKTAMASAQTLVMDINVNPLHNLLFFVIMSVVFTATVLFPIKNLRKMKIAEQIKYE